MLLSLSLIAFQLLGSLSFAGAKGGDLSFQPLAENRVYEFKVGNNGFYADARVQYSEGKYQVRIPIFVLGASLFGMVSYEEVMSVNKYDRTEIRPEYFKWGIRNFRENSVLLNRVIEIFKEVERVYNHPKFSLKLELSFVENELYYHRPNGAEVYRNNKNFPYSYFLQQEFIQALQKNHRINSKRLAVIFTPYSVGNLMSPVGWDLYSKDAAYLIAHEFGHHLGVTSEGFLMKNYPLDGLMTDGTALKVLRQHRSIGSRLQNVDLMTILSSIFNSLNGEIQLTTEQRRELLSKTIDANFKEPIMASDGRGYYGMSGKERTEHKHSLYHMAIKTFQH